MDPPILAKKMRDSVEAEFDVLSDEEGILLDLLGARHAGGGSGGVDIAQSASFLVAPDGTVHWHRYAPNYRVRPKPEEILEAYDALER